MNSPPKDENKIEISTNKEGKMFSNTLIEAL
jgi:hypothetical protein